MTDWIVLIAAIVAGGVLLVGPRWIGFPTGFSGSTLLGFAFLSVGMTAPIAWNLDRMMLDAGAGPDAFIGVWNLWWTRYALTHGSDPLVTSFLYWPSGTSLALHTHSVTYGVLTLPFQMVFAQSGPPGIFGIYNLILLVSFTLSGYFTYRLALHETGHRGASLIAGVIFAFCAFRFANTVRLHVIATEFLVLFVWAFVAWIRQPRALGLLAVLGAGWLLAHASLEYTAQALLACAWIALSRIVPTRIGPAAREVDAGTNNLSPSRSPTSTLNARPDKASRHNHRNLPRWVAAALILFAVSASAPLAWRVMQRVSAGGIEFDPRLGEHFSADLFDLVLPNPRHPLWGDLTEGITAGFHLRDAGFGTHFGILSVILFLLTLRWSIRAGNGRRWMLGALFFGLLALGPVLHVHGQSLSIPLPQALLTHVPLLGGTRTPIRYFAMAQLCLAIAVASGWTGWLRAQRRRTAKDGASDVAPNVNRDAVSNVETHAALAISPGAPHRREVLLGIGVLFTSLAAPMTMEVVEVPRIYREVRARAEGREPATLLHVPGLSSRDNLLYQTVHEQRLADDVSTSIPLHDGAEEVLRDRVWEIFALGFARPGFVAGLNESERQSLQELASTFLHRYSIRWIVVPASPEHQSVGTSGRIPPELLGPPAYDAYRENLRHLGPVWEQESQGFTVFEF